MNSICASFLKDLKNTGVHLLAHGRASNLLPLATIGEDFPAPASVGHIPYHQKDKQIQSSQPNKVDKIPPKCLQVMLVY